MYFGYNISVIFVYSYNSYVNIDSCRVNASSYKINAGSYSKLSERTIRRGVCQAPAPKKTLRPRIKLIRTL